MILVINVNPTMQNTLIFDNALSLGNVNRTSKSFYQPSGKGINVCYNLSALKKKSVLLSQSGGIFHKTFVKNLKEHFLFDYVLDKDFEIRTCTTLISYNEKEKPLVTEVVEEGNPVNPQTEKKIRQRILKYSKRKDIESCIITGSKAKGFRNDFFPFALEKFLENDIPVIMDVRQDDLKDSLYLMQNKKDKLSQMIIKVNGSEFVETFGYVDLFDIACEYNVNVCVTYGENGASCVYHSDTEIKTYPAEKFGNVLNTTGCGDAFASGIASLIHKGFDKELFYKSVEKGNYTASLKATKAKPALI